MLIKHITKHEFCEQVISVSITNEHRHHFKVKSLEYIYDYLDDFPEPMEFYPLDIHICWGEYTLKELCEETSIEFDPDENDFDKFIGDASEALSQTVYKVDNDTFLTWGQGSTEAY